MHLEDGDEEDLTEEERGIWETYLSLQDKNQVHKLLSEEFSNLYIYNFALYTEL